ncbi:hypothetical protein H4R99_000827 [Coemansia sp. RSA 1722]|nr:hypothetical protein IWW45_003624 [Coemansia sp. RSA 485]KAJ2605823.1 hypothetical protein H4R99_000827 [Coemansia sp. RSA 1722]
MLLYNAIGLLLLSNLRTCTGLVPEQSISSNGSASPQATSSTGPIWFSRVPDVLQQNTHDTHYLYCKMAHNGRSQWTVSPTDTSYENQSHVANNEQQEQKCTKCFCLPDTQRIGCVHTSCTEATDTGTGEQLPRRLQQKMHTKRSVASSDNKHSNKAAIYVNHEACIKAKNAISATHKCKSCVCRQNGALVCTNDAANPACGSANMDKPGKRHADSLLAPFVRRNNEARGIDKGPLPLTQFSSYAECVRAHHGQSSFKQDCNTCACGENGAVFCTLMACPTSSLPTSSAPSEPTSTCTPRVFDTYQSYDQCVDANGGARFKRECNYCRCMNEGAVACTRMACPRTCS